MRPTGSFCASHGQSSYHASERHVKSGGIHGSWFHRNLISSCCFNGTFVWHMQSRLASPKQETNDIRTTRKTPQVSRYVVEKQKSHPCSVRHFLTLSFSSQTQKENSTCLCRRKSNRSDPFYDKQACQPPRMTLNESRHAFAASATPSDPLARKGRLMKKEWKRVEKVVNVAVQRKFHPSYMEEKECRPS